ncbi:MAG: hypothetical protein AN482_08415 [Anabaena sp. LE011-02]|nr:MAG: hypothetical protein AN482_08415 [Anabaena sp. LE011-02]
MSGKKYPIGTVISDEETPTFETVRIKLKAGKDVKPGTLVKMNVSREGEKTLLIGRIRSGYEKNPNASVAGVTVSDNLGLRTPSMPEEYSTDISRVVEADLIEEIIGEEIRSPQNLPNSLAEVFIADSSEVVRVLGIDEKQDEGLYLGETVGGVKTDIILKKSAIQRHFFICGTTGSGKSYAMGVVAEELIKHNLPVIFIDTQDEYSEFVIKNGGKVVEPGKDFTIRISSLTESELISILPEVTQKNSLHCDVIGKAFEKLQTDLKNGKINKFRLHDIESEIDNTAKSLSSKSGDHARLADTVKRKLKELEHPIFGDGVDWRIMMYPSLAINCKNMTSKQLQTLATVILRELQNLRLKGHIPPYVAVVDEAHLFVPKGESSPCKQITIRGFGMIKEQVNIIPPSKGGCNWKVELNEELIKQHLATHIFGKYFLNSIESDDSLWNNGNFLIGSSDVSQHRSSVPTPARFFNRTVPFLLNNAAGAIVRVENGKAIFDEGRFNPEPTQDLLQWMLIDPSYQDELDPEDFHRCTASAMDIGQYIFDHEYLLNAGRDCPNIILRDGSLFPQDAYLDNYLINNKRGLFTQKAIQELLKCLNSARDFNRIYCGVSKNVRLKVYSAVVEWYIAKYIDSSWETGNYTLTDGQAMTLLLSSPDCFENGLKRTICTCLIRRSFTTRATLNEKANLNDLEPYFERYRNKIKEDGSRIDIEPYRQLCKIFHTYMFFIGHSNTPTKLLPRYEFFSENNDNIETISAKILTAIKYCSFLVDEDHSFMSDEPISYLIPSVTQKSHVFSKDVGKCLTQNVKQELLYKYQSFIKQIV